MRHDEFLKKSLENPKIAQEFLETHLPHEIKAIVDIPSFKVAKESFIEDNLKSKFVDVLFENEKNEYILILVQHQSTNNHFIALESLKYNCCIWERYREKYPDSKNLPLIYNVVFYNGPRPFNSPRNIWELIKNKDLAEKFLFKYQLIDTKDMLDKELQTKPYSGFMQFFMKYIYSKNMIEIWQKASEIFDFKKLNINYLESTLWYTIDRVDESNQNELHKIITKATTTKEGEDLMRSLADKWMEEGKAAGIQEVAVSMLLTGDSSEKVARITGLTIKAVENLKKSLRNSKN